VNDPAAQIHAIYRHLTDTTNIYWPATVRDLSTSAIRLTVPRPIRPGRLMSVRLSSPHDALTITRLVLVVGFQAHGPMWQIVGLFSEALSDDELRKLLPQAVHPAHEVLAGAH
jgi:hypothetical protein